MIFQYYKVLKQIEHKTEIWTGDFTLKSIYTYINGYSHALRDYNLIESNANFPTFNNWIANRLGFYESTAGWVNMILAITIGLNPKSIEWLNFDEKVSQNTHKKSVIKFYQLLEEFINETKRY